MQRNTAAGLVGLAVALAATAACTDDAADTAGGGEQGAESAAFDESRLAEMMEESARLTVELEAAELRVMERCLEDKGFTVHDQLYFAPPPPADEVETLFEHYPFEGWLPEVEEAERFGLGAWMMTDEGRSSDLAQAYADHEGFDLDAEEAMLAGEGEYARPDNSAFEALSPQEQYDWYAAFYGEDLAASENAHLIGEEPTRAGGGTDDGGGEIDMAEQPDYVEPEPGGCKREMIDALYGDMRLVVEGGEGEAYSGAYWYYRPENPTEDLEAHLVVETLYRERIATAEGELVGCLADRGHPDWEFTEEGLLPVSDYFWELYTGEADVHDHPDLPDDAPAEFEDRLAFEIAFAVDLAECGDETGFRETATEAHEDTQADYYLSMETQVYTWQEEMRGIIAEAQELIEG